MYWSDQMAADNPRATAHMKAALQPKTFKKDNKKVFDAFVKACGDQKRALKALTWGEYPSVGVNKGLINVANKQMCGVNPPAFFNQNANVILISDVRVWPLEKCSWEGDVVKNKRRFECTLLHEMVHWVRMSAGIPDEDWDNFPDSPMEAGEQFEIWAYGRRTCTSDEIEDALFSVRE